jgi:hypothetical protein
VFEGSISEMIWERAASEISMMGIEVLVLEGSTFVMI